MTNFLDFVSMCDQCGARLACAQIANMGIYVSVLAGMLACVVGLHGLNVVPDRV
jgi:hypothetical protein